MGWGRRHDVATKHNTAQEGAAARWQWQHRRQPGLLPATPAQPPSGADLGDAALHDEEVRVVDVELHAVKQVLHTPAVRLEGSDSGRTWQQGGWSVGCNTTTARWCISAASGAGTSSMSTAASTHSYPSAHSTAPGHSRQLRHLAVDEVLGAPANDKLARDRDLIQRLIPHLLHSGVYRRQR